MVHKTSKIIKLEIELQDNDLLHVGTVRDPLRGKDNPIFKIGDIPAIPASSFKGALRYQLENLLIRDNDKLANIITQSQHNNNYNDKLLKEMLKPCIPATEPTYAERALIGSLYRKQYEKGKHVGSCFVIVENNQIILPTKNKDGNPKKEEIGVCPVCYFLGARGLPGFVKIYNFTTSNKSATLSQPISRRDRICNVAAYQALAEAEYVYATESDDNKFYGKIEILIEDKVRNFRFGDARKIEVKDNERSSRVIDMWLDDWKESVDTKMVYLEELLLCAIKNINELGGHKSKGSGKVKVKVVNNQ